MPLLAALVMGAAGLLVLGVQPLLYAAYVAAGAIDSAGLGRLAAVEIVMLSLGCGIGILLLGRVRTVQVMMAGTALLVTGNLLPAAVPLLIARAIAGTGGGLLLALAAAAIARRRDVDRAAAGFLFLQAATQTLAVQLTSSSTAAATEAASAGQIQQLLAMAALACLPLVAIVPASLAPLPPLLAGGSARPTGTGGLGLVVAGAFVGAVVGIWAYLGLWMEARGLQPAAAGALLTIALVGQMIGALLAMALSRVGRSSSRALAAGMTLLAALALLVWVGPAAPAAMLLAGLFGTAWMLATPALTGFLAEVDRDRTSLPHAATAQLFGAALVPPLAGQVGLAHGMDGVLIAFAVVVLASLVLLALVRRHGSALPV